jgi:ribosomal protein S12 methylthiotransferase
MLAYKRIINEKGLLHATKNKASGVVERTVLGADDRAGCFAYSSVQGATANDLPGMLPIEVRNERRARFMQVAEEVSVRKLQKRLGSRMQILVDSAPGMGKKGGLGRSYADAPEIDGEVKLLRPEKISKTLKVGEFTQALVVGVDGHDLIAQPI